MGRAPKAEVDGLGHGDQPFQPFVAAPRCLAAVEVDASDPAVDPVQVDPDGIAGKQVAAEFVNA